MESEFVTAVQESGPFGAKGIGESATFGVSPAIANAIDDAIGIRLTELPIKPETVLRALRESEGQPIRRRRMSEPRVLRFTLNGQAMRAASRRRIGLWSRRCKASEADGCAQSLRPRGLCGCCTVLVDNDAVSGCPFLSLRSQPTAKAHHHRRTSGMDGALSPVQQAFIETGAFQCGFCAGLHSDDRAAPRPQSGPDRRRHSHYLSGNLCRCAAYRNSRSGETRGVCRTMC